jgi:hypothetical protein
MPTSAHWRTQFAPTMWLGDSHRRIAYPVAVPDKIFGLTLILDFIDRGQSLYSLAPPPAAVVSLPSQ